MRDKNDSDNSTDRPEKGRKAVADSVKSGEEVYAEALEQVTTLVRKHPIEALAIGFGVGCFVGLVLTRR